MDARYSKEDLNNALEVLKSGGIILYPTDTVWGIGCDATNADAVKKIYEIKKRSTAKQMLVLIDTPSRLSSYMQEVPTLAWDIIDINSKPLTIIYPTAKNLANNIISHDGSIAIRITNEVFSQALCSRLRKPIVSTSANLSDQPTPRNFSEIDKSILSAVDYVVQYRQDDHEIKEPSGIIKLGVYGEIKVIRE